MQKIEEITLYTIEQEKEKEIEGLKKQNSKIENQERKVEELKALVETLVTDKNQGNGLQLLPF